MALTTTILGTVGAFMQHAALSENGHAKAAVLLATPVLFRSGIWRKYVPTEWRGQLEPPPWPSPTITTATKSLWVAEPSGIYGKHMLPSPTSTANEVPAVAERIGSAVFHVLTIIVNLVATNQATLLWLSLWIIAFLALSKLAYRPDNMSLYTWIKKRIFLELIFLLQLAMLVVNSVAFLGWAAWKHVTFYASLGSWTIVFDHLAYSLRQNKPFGTPWLTNLNLVLLAGIFWRIARGRETLLLSHAECASLIFTVHFVGRALDMTEERRKWYVTYGDAVIAGVCGSLLVGHHTRGVVSPTPRHLVLLFSLTSFFTLFAHAWYILAREEYERAEFKRQCQYLKERAAKMQQLKEARARQEDCDTAAATEAQVDTSNCPPATSTFPSPGEPFDRAAEVVECVQYASLLSRAH